MTRRPAYIAAPYGDPDPDVRAWHVRRACALARLAQACGYAPIVVHPAIEAGAYGDDSDPAAREAGLESALTLIGVVMRAGGDVWPLARDDGTWSPGTAREVESLAAALTPSVWTWAHWRRDFARASLLPLWESLRERPGGSP